VAVIYDPVGMPEGWPGVKAAVSVVRQREVGGVSATTSHHYVSSHGGTALELAGLIRGHWGGRERLALDTEYRPGNVSQAGPPGGGPAWDGWSLASHARTGSALNSPPRTFVASARNQPFSTAA
jgi:hypothetical protein